MKRAGEKPIKTKLLPMLIQTTFTKQLFLEIQPVNHRLTFAFLGRQFWFSLMKRATRKSFKTNLFVMLIETTFVKRIFPAIQRTNYVIGMPSFSRLISDLTYEKSLWKTFQWKVVWTYYTNNFCKKTFF